MGTSFPRTRTDARPALQRRQIGRRIGSYSSPTWSALAGRLIGRAVLKLPTGAMLRIDFDSDDWQTLSFGSGELRWLLPPKLVGKHKGGK